MLMGVMNNLTESVITH